MTAPFFFACGDVAQRVDVDLVLRHLSLRVFLLRDFSLHAGVAAEAHEGQKLERLCRYIARPAISDKRLSLSPQGKVRYQRKTPWKNGTTHVEFEPVEFFAKREALVPPPRAHLTRFHGVFAPNANLRAQLTPSAAANVFLRTRSRLVPTATAAAPTKSADR